jgi:hypothetical protein
VVKRYEFDPDPTEVVADNSEYRSRRRRKMKMKRKMWRFVASTYTRCNPVVFGKNGQQQQHRALGRI